METSGEQAVFEAAVATGGIEENVELLARIIETDGTVFVAGTFTAETELGGYLCTGSFAGTQELEETVLFPFTSVRRIVFFEESE